MFVLLILCFCQPPNPTAIAFLDRAFEDQVATLREQVTYWESRKAKNPKQYKDAQTRLAQKLNSADLSTSGFVFDFAKGVEKGTFGTLQLKASERAKDDGNGSSSRGSIPPVEAGSVEAARMIAERRMEAQRALEREQREKEVKVKVRGVYDADKAIWTQIGVYGRCIVRGLPLSMVVEDKEIKLGGFLYRYDGKIDGLRIFHAVVSPEQFKEWQSRKIEENAAKPR